MQRQRISKKEVRPTTKNVKSGKVTDLSVREGNELFRLFHALIKSERMPKKEKFSRTRVL